MKTMRYSILGILLTLLVSFSYSNTALAQDAAEVDSAHYKVVLENDQVRVLRINYGPGEKSVMHSHPEGLVIFMTDGEGKFNFPDGKTQDQKFTAGTVIWTPASTHQPENTGKKPFEVIQIEMKKIDDD